MGTSVNQRSPNTSNWRIVQQAYDDPNFPMDRALQEIWRAADNQPEGDLIGQLSQPAIGSFAVFAARAASAADAAREVLQDVSEHKAASLAADIAKRAVIQSVGRENATEVFVQRLFAEATNYLVSRDLPGHIAPGSRLQNVADARTFKRQISDMAADAVARMPPPASLAGNDWSSYVATVVAAIQQRRQGR